MGISGPVIPENHPTLVNTVKAAEIAGVTVRTIHNWMKAGKVEFLRTAGNGVRIYADSLLREPWVAE